MIHDINEEILVSPRLLETIPKSCIEVMVTTVEAVTSKRYYERGKIHMFYFRNSAVNIPICQYYCFTNEKEILTEDLIIVNELFEGIVIVQCNREYSTNTVKYNICYEHELGHK
ncbi:hypothetical protein RJG79_08590 [Mycoplasmatota bacterium WC44]